MKKAIILSTITALLLSGCAEEKESSPPAENALSSSGGAPAESLGIVAETSDDAAAPEEKVALVIPIPSTVSERVPDFQTSDPLVEPIFELDGISYELDALNWAENFMMDGSGDILIKFGEERVGISEYAELIKEEQGRTPPEILTALQELDTLEYIGRAEFIEDTANALEYHNSDLYYYRDKILLIEPILTTEEEEYSLYHSTMFVPCD